MTDEHAPGTESTKESPVEVEEDLDFGRTVLQFFIIPAFVVAICVGIFFFFAWLVSDEKSGVDYLNLVRAGSANQRWQAAFELSKIITMESEKDRMEGLVPEMIYAFEDATDDDPRVRHYLALSLGHLADPAAVPALIAGLGDDDPTTRLYASWALGSIGDQRAVEPVLARVSDDDPGVRKMAVYALGALGDARAIPRLQAALNDPQRDVSWNAAVSLAQLGDDAGETQLLQMLDPEFLAGVSDMDEAQKLLATESAIRAAALVESGPIDDALRRLADEHSNLGIRRVALEVLEGSEKGQKKVEP